MGVLDEKLFCVMCGGEVPADRRKRRSITCSDGCKKERTAYLHRRVERTRCRYCAQPVTPEDSRRYRTWRKYEAIVTASNPKYSDELREFIDALYVKIPKLPGAKKVDMPDLEAWREGWRKEGREDSEQGRVSRAEALRGKPAVVPYVEGWDAAEASKKVDMPEAPV